MDGDSAHAKEEALALASQQQLAKREGAGEAQKTNELRAASNNPPVPSPTSKHKKEVQKRRKRYFKCHQLQQSTGVWLFFLWVMGCSCIDP
jgi:hypothetical protein